MRAFVVAAMAFMLATAGAPAALAADTSKASSAKTGKKCDTTKVYTGPKGGRYTLTENCRKIYIKKRK